MKNKILKTINKGISKDTKYIVESNGNKSFLRVTNYSFDRLQELEKIRISIQDSKCNINKIEKINVENNKIYCYYNFIEGFLLSNHIQEITNEKKEEYGKQAGEILKNIHSIKVETKMNSNIELHNKVCDMFFTFEDGTFKNVLEILIHEVLTLYKHVNIDECVYLHADYSTTNMLINNDEVFIIDFERYEVGNKVRDFSFIYTYDEDRIYAKSLINAYFNNEVPKNFWIEFKYYSYLFVLYYCMWNYKKFGKYNNSIDIANKLISDFSDNKTIPSWYGRKKCF